MASTQKQISLFPILLIIFIGTLGFSIVLPFLVFLVTDFGGNALVFGVLIAMYPAFQLVGAPLLGRWSDIYGRRKVLLISQGGTLAAWIVFLVALFLPLEPFFDIDSAILGTFVITLPMMVLFLARALDGITGGNVSVANAYLADVTSDKERNKNFGKMAISSNLGFVVGPTLAGLLGATVYEEILPVLAALFLSVIALFVIAFKLKESKPIVIKEEPEKVNVRKVFVHECKDCYKIEDPKKISFKDAFRIKHVPYMLMLYFLIFLGFSILYTSFPIHAVVGLEWNVTDMGVFFAFLAGIMAVVQGPVLSKATTKFSDGFLTLIGSVILGTSFIFFVSDDYSLLYFGAAFFAVGNGLMWPSVLSILSKVAGKEHQGSVQGFAGSFGSLASIIGLIFGGIVYEWLGATTFLTSAAVIFSVSFLSCRLLKIVPK
ncbi:MAG: MFS transporter [Nitrososphaerales archaeon]